MSLDYSVPSYYESYDSYAPITSVGQQAFTTVSLMISAIISIAIAILSIIAMWKIFTKAGQKGWKCLIPIYNAVVLFKIAGISPLWILAYLAGIIPILGYLVVLGVTIYFAYNLAKAFGKGVGFTVGLIFLDTIFIMILAFGSAEYQLEKK